ncbi:MAG: isocitrate lyase/PEP mutase family protein [Janthinobacterium lividum]
MSLAKQLRASLAKKEILVVPGGGSPLELRLIEQAGFEAGYISGYATAASRYGLPDIGMMAYGEIEDMVKATRNVTNLPLIVDCDTGYGDVANVMRTVRGMELLGVAAIQLEDQAWPKRCGHMDSKVVEPRDVALRKIRAAVAARSNPDTVIIARTDARGPHGLDEAFERLRMFKEAGADVLFVDGPQSMDDLERICKELPGPLMANMSESGLTPMLSAQELQEMGFDIVIFPSSTVRLTVKIVQDFLVDLKQTGDSRPWIDRQATLDQNNTAMDMDRIRAFEAQILAAGK